MEERRYGEFADYFKELVKNYSGEQGQKFLADTLMTSQSTISKILKGVTLPPDLVVKQLNILYGVDISEKVREARERYENSKYKTETEKEHSIEQVETKTKPRLPVSAAAGSLAEYSQGVMLEQCEQMPIIRNFPDYDYTMFVKGNSMEPKYESGDEIAIKKAEYVIEWGKDYVLDTQDGVIFKKIYEEGDNIRCVSYNHDEYSDFLVPKNIIFGYYKFVGLVRV
jgi:phage repressor protein C with HTH and peptisase S24 domain